MSTDQLAPQIKEAIGSHGMWKLKLKTAINMGRSDFSPNDVRCADNCTFGQWMQSSEIDPQTRLGTPFRVIDRLHSEFHKCAADVLEFATSGRSVEATRLLEGEFTQQSEKLVRGLRKWKGEVS